MHLLADSADFLPLLLALAVLLPLASFFFILCFHLLDLKTTEL